jgi:hypothetical protein
MIMRVVPTEVGRLVENVFELFYVEHVIRGWVFYKMILKYSAKLSST